jgi:transcriptional regulator with XRE-family HTH domain
MISTEDFVKRLEILFDHFGLSAATFSDKIGVQRSGVSHLLSGRNKPSLDFVLKIISAFPEVDLYWLLTGKGNLLRDEDQPHAPKEKAKTKSEAGIEKIIIFNKDGSFSEYTPKK